MYDRPPCCAADALKRIKPLSINGIPTGIVMMERIFDEIKMLDITDDICLEEALVERVKIYNYVLEAAGVAYAGALIREYRNYRPAGT